MGGGEDDGDVDNGDDADDEKEDEAERHGTNDAWGRVRGFGVCDSRRGRRRGERERGGEAGELDAFSGGVGSWRARLG